MAVFITNALSICNVQPVWKHTGDFVVLLCNFAILVLCMKQCLV